MRLKVIIISALLIAAMTATFACSSRKGNPGSKSNPIRFFFMPLKGKEAFQKNSPIIIKFLEQNTGLSITTVDSPDFITIAKGLGNGEADIAFTNTLGYLLARDASKAEAHLSSVFGDVYKTYRGEIIAKVEGPVNSPADLNGKTIAFSDPFSSSGYLYALKFFQDHNIKPKSTVFAGGHKRAVEMVYNGEVDAAATYHERPTESGSERDSRIEILKDHPDVISKVKIVALTDEIPSGPIAIRKDLPADVKSKLVGALVEFARTSEGRAALNDLYNITGLELAKDADYDDVQKVIMKLGKSIQEVVPGGVTYYNTKVSPMLAN